MRNFLPPRPPGPGPWWYVWSVALHTVLLGALVWVSSHTRDTYGVTRLIRLSEGPAMTRQFAMRLSDPARPGTTRSLPDALGWMGPVSIAAVPEGRARPGGRAPGRDPATLSIGIPNASTTIPGAIVVGTTRPIGPAFGDGRLWEAVILGAVAAEQQVWGDKETELALIVAGMISSIIEDSLVVRGGVPDWVTTIGGQEWGIDSEYIHLGPIKIPTVLAALLGFAQLPQMGNYELAQQQQWLADVRNQILNQAQRMDQMQSFKRNVREMEARKRREREEERRRRVIVAGRDSILGRF